MKTVIVSTFIGIAICASATVSAQNLESEYLNLEERTLFANKYVASPGQYRKANIESNTYYIPVSEASSGNIVAGFIAEPWIGFVEYNGELCIANYKGVRFCEEGVQYSMTN